MIIVIIYHLAFIIRMKKSKPLNSGHYHKIKYQLV